MSCFADYAYQSSCFVSKVGNDFNEFSYVEPFRLLPLLFRYSAEVQQVAIAI
jgi:hypothetical protein